MVTDEQLKTAQENYWNHLENVVAKCPHDQEIVFAMMGDETSYRESKMIYKCLKCNGLIYEYDAKLNQFCKKTFMGRMKNPKYEEVTGKDDPRLIPLYGKTMKDLAREMYIDISKHTWKDLK